MPLEAAVPSVRRQVIDLNHRFSNHSATSILEHALHDPDFGNVALVSSFGAESVALLHMLSVIDRTVPVIFLDTELLFAETLTYQQEVAAALGLTNLRIIRPDRQAMFARDGESLLHRTNPDACCALRKTEPMQRALSGFDAWVTGRKRFQATNRMDLATFETDPNGRIKVNPLAHWSTEDVQIYMDNNRLPRHPLVKQGYPSIGCLPCTSRVANGEDIRAGRWRGQAKTECGIHFPDAPANRNPVAA